MHRIRVIEISVFQLTIINWQRLLLIGFAFLLHSSLLKATELNARESNATESKATTFKATELQATESEAGLSLNKHFDRSPAKNIKFIIGINKSFDTITGKIIDNVTGKPLMGVHLKKKGFKEVISVSDSSGNFKLSISEGNLSTLYTIELRDYDTKTWRVTDGLAVRMVPTNTIFSDPIAGISDGPMYVIHVGKKMYFMNAVGFKEIPENFIREIKILKYSEAISSYGQKGANGIIKVKIKKAYAGKIDFSKSTIKP